MNLTPYTGGNIVPPQVAELKNQIERKMKAEGRKRMFPQEEFRILALERSEPKIFEIMPGTENDWERKIALYIQERTGLNADFIKVQYDRMAVRMFIPEKVYRDLTMAGISVPSKEVQAERKNGPNPFNIKLLYQGELWVPIISTWGKLFIVHGKAEFEWWIAELLRIKASCVKRKLLPESSKNKVILLPQEGC